MNCHPLERIYEKESHMQFAFLTPQGSSSHEQPVEIVERKGIGHPDTLADFIAETFSNMYSQQCLALFGGIPNHWVDKVVLSGAQAKVTFGEARFLKPITAYLFGKVTRSVGGVVIDIEQLFHHAVQSVFEAVFGKNNPIGKHVTIKIDTNDGIGSEHPPSFYAPLDPQQLPSFGSELFANDTGVGCAYAGYSETEQLVILLENFINSTNFKTLFPETGYDVKVFARRHDRDVHITVCVPFIAEKTASLRLYQEKRNHIQQLLLEKAKQICPTLRPTLQLNTKDTAYYAYLTVFGTALDKGDYGVVGRGNRYNGVIPSHRGVSMEAVNGKNPLHHTGKLYNVLAYEIASHIARCFHTEVVVSISTNNGCSLYQPTFISIQAVKDIMAQERYIRELISSFLSQLGALSEKIINANPVAAHIHRFTYLTAEE
jgi:S-adenosylmethionine synthetase